MEVQLILLHAPLAPTTEPRGQEALPTKFWQHVNVMQSCFVGVPAVLHVAVEARRKVPSTSTGGVERAEQPCGWFPALVGDAASRAPDRAELREPSCKQTDLHNDKGITAYKKYCNATSLWRALGGNANECLQHVVAEQADPKGVIHALLWSPKGAHVKLRAIAAPASTPPPGWERTALRSAWSQDGSGHREHGFCGPDAREVRELVWNRKAPTFIQLLHAPVCARAPRRGPMFPTPDGQAQTDGSACTANLRSHNVPTARTHVGNSVDAAK